MLFVELTLLSLVITLVSSQRRIDENGWSSVNQEHLTAGKSTSQPDAASYVNFKREASVRKKSISEQKCEEYAKSVYETVSVLVGLTTQEDVMNHCASSVEEQIVGGERAKPRVYPHMALIGYGFDGYREWKCGGSLISEKFVLSAAHCKEVEIDRIGKLVNATVVRLGELDTSSDLDDASPIDIKIEKRFIHPSYDKALFYNDIALFQLASNVEFNKYIRPICLHNSFYIDTSKFKPIVTGWGVTTYVGYGSSSLQQLQVDLVGQENCRQFFKKYEKGAGSHIPRGIENASMVCAGAERGKDSCRGDSGGPLQIYLKDPYCMYSQIGIVSFGYNCAQGYPGVYTRVSNYVTWIESIVWP